MEKKIESLIKEHKIIAILRGVPSEKIVDVAKALYDGGIRLLEITFNQKSETKLIDTPNAIRAVPRGAGGQDGDRSRNRDVCGGSSCGERGRRILRTCSECGRDCN